MDTGLTVKPRDTISRIGIGRTAVARTELAPSQSVRAVEETTPTHMPLVESTGREPVINPQAQALLSREQEERMRRARRAADEALQRRNAYDHAAHAGHPPTPQPMPGAPDQEPHADFEV